MKEEKKFIFPEAIVIEFHGEDIIVTSGGDLDEFDEGNIPD